MLHHRQWSGYYEGMHTFLRFLLLVGASAAWAAGAENLVRNGGFELGTDGWRTWSREPKALSAELETQDVHTGRAALRLDHRGSEDWSLEPALRLTTQPGDWIELSCWVQLQGQGTATLCFSTWDSQGQVMSWSYGSRTARARTGWQHLRTRIVAPFNILHIQPRLIGHGPATVRVDDYELLKLGSAAQLPAADLPQTLLLSNAALQVSLHTADAALWARPARGSRTWKQKPLAGDCVVRSAKLEGDFISCALLHGSTGLDLLLTVRLQPDVPELLVELIGSGDMPAPIRFPHPYLGQPGDYLVIPMNEGISYPVDDPAIPPMHLIAYGGHGICMPFFGTTDGKEGEMAILETPDDAAVAIDRLDGNLVVVPEWQPQRGQFGYARAVRYVFLNEGGHVAMAKRYRAYAKQRGLVRTLREKKSVNPQVDLLIGAVNVWCWERDAVALARDLQSAGIERILWSNRQAPDNINILNDLGVLTSRYDIYQDVMDPSNFPRLRRIHSDWTTNAWPQHIIWDANGQWIRGWGVESKDGSLIPCGVICDKLALDYARERVPAELATHPYRCRFIDTTTAAPWHECYHPAHPMTRTQSKQWKMELLRYISEDNHLVTGSETGHDAAVPFVHYFEGMLSLGPYRVPDAGRRMSEVWTNVPPRVAQFQLGHQYRLPLWELVYHDCVVAQWYWGDYNNKLPALWDKRDLFNVLYGVPPMFMFNRSLWEANKGRFVQSYQNTIPHVRKVGYEEMVDHRFLTQDRSVQQTVFANGVRVTVNFGEKPYARPEGGEIMPLGYEVH